MEKENTSIRLKKIMAERNLKQVDILDKAKPYCEKYGVKLGKNDLSQYVTGKVEPGQKKLSVLSEALGVSEVWLMGYDVALETPDPKKQKKRLTAYYDRLNTNKTSSTKIPVLGYVRAGIPLNAVEEILDWEEIPEKWLESGDEYFALSIKGDSMEPKFSEGDVAIIRKQDDVESGDIAIILVNGDDATCKKVMKYSGGVRLVPWNPAYEVLDFSNQEIEELPVKIIGKVVELRAKFI